MLSKLLNPLRKKFKQPIIDGIYRFLMRSSKYLWGRKPFDIEELKLLTEALASQNLFGVDGKMVPAFEKEFAHLYGVPYAVASTSGTAAIHTALGALDLNPGDEVITAPITDLGTVIPILSLNAIPVFADIDASYNMDPRDVERKITDRTRAIVVVHLFGNPCDMDAMVAIARKHKIPLIEDCSQSHVTSYKGRYVGTIGDIGCFSFQQSKHMTTGDGGMTITSNAAYYERMKLYVDKGFMRKGWGARAYGFHAPNYRMNELTAAVGRAQIKKVKAVVQKRHEMGSLLTSLLSNVPGLTTAPVTDGGYHSYWLYPLLTEGIDIELFAKEMIKSHFWSAPGYTGKPIYLCSESLTAKKTYGNSQFPFNSTFASKKYEYVEGLCPKAEMTLKQLVTMPWDESWDELRVRKAAEVIKSTLARVRSGEESSLKAVAQTKAPVNAKQTEHSVSPQATLNIGIIGCGQMGRWHLDAYKKNLQVKCVAFVDTDLKKAEEFAQEVGGKAYDSTSKMLAQEKLDGVSVCTIPSTHERIVLDLLSAGVNVLCEKPLAISVREAAAMMAKAKEKERLCLTAFKFRFFEEVTRAKEIIDSGALGKIYNFRLMFGGQINMEGTWFANKSLSGGGIIMDNGPHAFDLIHYLLGSLHKVNAHASTFQNIQVEDTAQVSVTLSNGTVGTVDVSWNTVLPAANYLEIYGENGCLFLDFGGITYKYKTWDSFKRVANLGDIKQAFQRQINHFVEAIPNQKTTVITNQDGLLAQEWIEQAYQSLAGVVEK